MRAAAAVSERAGGGLSFGPWVWSPRVDLGVFAGSAAFALGVCALGWALGVGDGALPGWGFLVFVVAIDVAHVYSTLFRTYLDGEELRRHRARYLLVPLVCYAAGVGLYLLDALWFWRVLAYVALFHFVRQQVGWAAIYRARSGRRGRVDEIVDSTAIYAATLYPVVHWHARLATTEFAWFVEGDFVDLGAAAAAAVPWARAVWVLALAVFVVRQVQVAVTTGAVHVGKIVIVATTAAIWWVGIVATNSDFYFTVTNVVVHGVPYVALLWFYARERSKEAPELLGSQVVGWGLGAFLGLLLLVAFVEEMAWDQLVWHDHGWLFGDGVVIGTTALAFLVPLLALPQATHYVLDGMLWRRADTREHPAQRRALGFDSEARIG